MIDDWDNRDFARHWDQTANKNNPTRAEQLDILISLLAAIYQDGKTILDLGIGSGLVETHIFSRLPYAAVVGVDSSLVMLEMAKQRLAAFAPHCTFIHQDIAAIAEIVLPATDYDIVLSVQALHHLPYHQQQAVFRFIADLLPANGFFLFMDRIALDARHFSALYQAQWKRLEQIGEGVSDLSEADFLQRLQSKKEHPATLEEHLSWLNNAGFAATCLHLYLDRMLVAAVKREAPQIANQEVHQPIGA